MLYDFNEACREISIGAICEDHLTMGSIGVEALKASYQILGISEEDLNECVLDSVNFRSHMEMYHTYWFGILNVPDISDIYGPKDKIGFLIRKNLFLIIDIQDTDNSTRDTVQYAVQRNRTGDVTLEDLIGSFFERLIDDDNQKLDKKEQVIDGMEEDIHKGDMDRKLIGEILALKKEVTHFRNYYEQLIVISEMLAENRNELFSAKGCVVFRLLTEKIRRLSERCLMLKENLVQTREAYAASLDYNLNAVMKLFTVVTTIFQPLTLIAGWYGMNFVYMPELSWRYGYAMVFTLSLLVIIFCLWLFRKKHLLQR